MSELQSRTWQHRQACWGVELRCSVYADASGVKYSLRILGKGQHSVFDFTDAAIIALTAAVSEIERDPSRVAEYPITDELTLVTEPSHQTLVNCQAKYRFASLEDLKELSERLHEHALVARLFH